MKKNNRWVIYVYIIFMITIFLTIMSFLSKYIYWNLDTYNNIKSFFVLYWVEKWISEEVIINYFDNPKNLKYINTKYYDKDNFVSRYEDKIEYLLEEGKTFELSLTSADEEYNNNLIDLGYVDIFWNTQNTSCNINISLLRWEKTDNISLINHKETILKADNNVLLKAIKWDSANKVNVTFSTWAYFSWWDLVAANFVLNNYTVTSLSWSLDYYELTLDSDLDFNEINIISLVEWDVKNLWGQDIKNDFILVKDKDTVYKNRFRINDSSVWVLNKSIYEYKLIIKWDEDCPFLIEWFNKDWNKIKIPNDLINWELYINNSLRRDYKFEIIKDIKISNQEISNYLYKIY